MGNPEDREYEILFMGPSVDTAREKEAVIQGLQARFRLSQERAIHLLQRAPIVVKRGLTEEEGNRYAQAFHSIGAMVRIRKYSHPQGREREGGHIPHHPGEGGEYCAWEDMENLGFFQAFLTTLREILFSPTKFFGRMPLRRGLSNPLIFALIMGVLGKVLGLTYQQVLSLRFGELPGLSPGHFIAIAIALPLIVLAGLYIGCGIVHVCLTLVGGNRKGFEATFRVIAYAGATEIFSLIPFIGSIVTFIYALPITIIGLRESHGTSMGKAALAVFLPAIVLGAFVVAVAASLLYKLSQFL
jgi:hypothetical protein